MTPLYGKPRIVDDAVRLMVEVQTIHRPDLQMLYQRMTDSELGDICAFELFVRELLATYHIEDAGILRITLIQASVAWAACLVGLWTAREPDATPLLRKLPTALGAWRLMPPSVSVREAERNREFLMSAMRSMGIDEYLADRVVTLAAEQSIPPHNEEIRSLARRIAAGHLRHLTTLHRAAEHVLKFSPLARSSRRFFMTFIAHVTYRGLLIGYRAGQKPNAKGLPSHMHH